MSRTPFIGLKQGVQMSRTPCIRLEWKVQMPHLEYWVDMYRAISIGLSSNIHEYVQQYIPE